MEEVQGEEIFGREPTGLFSDYQGSGIFDKVSASEVIKILQDLTFLLY